ncbi:MAG: hypothetical protein K0S07_860 [Chlamydiales bacterium]|jgi:hypothetical protein|nr:hypothetical protein [Chlamydiales bacterium]
MLFFTSPRLYLFDLKKYLAFSGRKRPEKAAFFHALRITFSRKGFLAINNLLKSIENLVRTAINPLP